LKRLTPRLAVILLVVAAAFAAGASGAAAKTPCGEKVIDDWYGSKSGQLSHTYPLHCYRDALAIVKRRSDLDVYSNASQDILFALQLAIARGGGKGGPPDVTDSIYTADALPSWYGGPDAANGGQAPASVEVVPVTAPTGKSDPGPVPSILQSSSASSVPLPAIVLGAIAGLLLVLGSTAFVARRRQQRRETLRPQTEPGPPNG
jgi:hypothetical protein